MRFSERLNQFVPYVGFIAVVALAAMVMYSILFPQQELLRGVIVDKIYIPSNHATAQNMVTFSNYRAHDYLVSTQSHEQWVALVATENGDVLVHCDSSHYAIRHVGDTLHFKKYTGKVFGIEYKSHCEEVEGSNLAFILRKYISF